jgi:calcium-dependent protein kinase
MGCFVHKSVMNTKSKRRTSEKGRCSLIKSRKDTIFIMNDEPIDQIYEIDEEVLSNNHSIIRVGRLRGIDGNKYAIKSFEKTSLDSDKLDKLQKELEILNRVDHPNIIKFYETYSDEKYYHIAMEYCKGGDVGKRRYNEIEAAFVLYKLITAISYLHSLGIVHRGIRPENILYENDTPDADIRLIGFCDSLFLTNEYIDTIIGYPDYIAPEMLDKNYDFKSDIWSIGVVLYYMLSQALPFASQNASEIYTKLKDNEPPFTETCWTSIPDDTKKFIKCLLNKDPSERPTAIDVLNHNWFNSVVTDFSFKQLNKSLLNSFKTYTNHNKLKKLFLKSILKELSNDTEDIKKIKKLFYILDTEKTGKINVVNIIKAFETIGTKPKELKCLENQQLSYTKFILFLLKKKFSSEILTNTFRLLDVDGNGKIEVEDLSNVYKRSGRYKSHKEINDLLKPIGIGNITYDAFCNLLN